MLTQLIPMMGQVAAMPIVLPDYLSPLITYTQSGGLWEVNSSGFYALAANDVMTPEYDPVTLAFKGYPFWEARTSVPLWCRDFTNAVWVKSASMAAAKTATGIDGVANSASTLTASGANQTVLQSITLASSARWQDCFVKRRTGSGTIEMTMDNGATWTAVTVTAAWTRVSIPTQTLANPIVGLRIVTSGDAIDVDFFNNQNGPFATAPILTTSSAVTRAAPSCAITGANFASFYNQAQGTFVWGQLVNTINPSSLNCAFEVSDGTYNNRMLGFALDAAPDKVRFDVTVGGIAQATISAGDFIAGTSQKVAASYILNNIAASLSGAANVTDASATIPTVNRLTLGYQSAGGGYLNGWLPSLSYYGASLPSSLPSLSS